MVTFQTEKVSARITRIFGINTELMYLVEGEERAALLDTGSGFGSLKAVVEELTDKPVIVLLTHGHLDHAMGAGEFTDVYMNHADDDIYGSHGEKQFRQEGMRMSAEYDKLEDTDYIPTMMPGKIKSLQGGDSFELGEVTIDIYDCPGHTAGSVVMLIREENMLLLGDACNNFTFMFESYSLPIHQYENHLKKLKVTTAGKYNRVLASHGNGELPVDIIDRVIQVCEDIKSGDVDKVPFQFKGSTGVIAKAVNMPAMDRIDKKYGNIVYDPGKVW